MTSHQAIILFVCTLSLTACSAERAPSGARTTSREAKTGETITIISLARPQWRKDPNCFEQGAQTLDEATGYFDVERLKWRRSRTFEGYFYTNFEGTSFVAAQRTEDADELGEGRYQTDLYSDAPGFTWSAEPQTYWIEFIGREAICNSQSLDDTEFDVPTSRNLVRVDKILKKPSFINPRHPDQELRKTLTEAVFTGRLR